MTGDGDLGSGLVLSPSAQVGSGVRFGAHVVVHDDVVIGAGCVIADHAVLGKAPSLAPGSSAQRDPAGPLRLGDGVTVSTGAIVFAGAVVGAGTILGDQSYVRERSVIGEGSLVGRGSVVDNDVSIGDRVSIQTNVYVAAFSFVADDVFIGPGTTATNDNSMGRHARGAALRGARIMRAARVGAAVVLVPGVQIGEEAFVAAGAVVTRDVPARAIVRGVPAAVVGEVGDKELLELWR